ncbi:MAG: PASTA domain-containing protein, partial [Eggerthellaceae bacterium]|nr:PASTA domain-containing protein [Eggerthellaceae bacterium]
MKKFFVVLMMVVLTGLLAGCSCSPQASSSSSSSKSAQTQVQVPNLVSLDRQDATKLLVNDGFVLGAVTYENSDTVPNGHVISQKPEALTMADSGTKIDLVVSKGKADAADVTMPNLIGMSQTDAEKAIADANLVAVQEDPVVSTDVDPGKVCKQSIAAGTKIKEGTQVSFATALAPEDVSVPDETGKPIADAKAELEKAGLGVDISAMYNDEVEKDNVISQSVAPGTKVSKGTVVTLQVSLGAKPADKVKVPDIMTYTLDDAINALTSAGLTYRYSGDEDGTVIYQNPDAGTEVDAGSTVTFTLQHQSSLVAVPDVSGKSGTDAYAAISAAGLDFDYDSDNPDRTVSSTTPTAGTMVDMGSVVTAVYDDPPAPQPTGAWEVNTDSMNSLLSGDEQALISSADPNANAKAILATQVVNGTNYAVLCQPTDASQSWTVMTMTVDTSGTATISSTKDIDLTNIATTSSASYTEGTGAWEVRGGFNSALSSDVESAFQSALSGGSVSA